MRLTLDCTGCSASIAYEEAALRCPDCGEPLEVRGYERLAVGRPAWHEQSLAEHYAGLLPPSRYYRVLSLGEGFTPLVSAPRLASEFGISRLLVKNESVNPTWSFKDRGTLVAMAEAMNMDSQAVGVVSTGNMAASVAAYAARAGLPALVLISAEIPEEKLAPIMVYGPAVVRVRGDYPELYQATLRLEKSELRFLNSDAPARVEGSKTIAFEICEQTGYNAPDWVVVPTSSGGVFRGILKGFEEMMDAGLISHVPRIVCAQADGCAPIYHAWHKALDRVIGVSNPHTIAQAIANPRPPSGNAVLRRLRAGAGVSVAMSDEQILSAQLKLAATGVFVQPAAAVSLAAASQLARDGVFQRGDVVVCVATGGGLKCPNSVDTGLPSPDERPLADLESYVAEWCEMLSPRRLSR